MDVERLLLSKIIETRDLTPVSEAGITTNFFAAKSESRAVFETILRHYSEYGEVPTLATIKDDHPTYKFVKAGEAYEYLVDRLKQNRALAIIEEGLEAATVAFDKKDPKASQAAISKVLSQIGSELPATKDTDLTASGATRLERYRTYREFEGGLRGIPSGFASIDRATLGFQNGQLVTMIGPPKAGKSTLMVLATLAAHRHGVRPLFVGFEMSNEEQEERIDAILAGISHSRLRSGQLKGEEWEKLERSVRELENMPPLILSADISSTTTLSGLTAKIDSIKPDIVLVDGVYMMEDERGERQGSSQALTNLTRGFKRLAMNRDLPIVISTQVLTYKISKKAGLTADAIGYSSSFAQDSDVILGVNSTEDADINEVSLVLGRNSPKVKSFVHWDWETGNFEELSDDPFTFDE